MSFYLSQRSLDNMSGIDSRLQRIAERAIEITKIDFGIPTDGGRRTAERQHELFEDGKSRADGYHKRSKHQDGRAIDFYAYVDGEASWNELHLAMVAAAFLQAASEYKISVRWGGLWKKEVHGIVDLPHIELVES